MLVKTPGIVLHTLKYSETSIVTRIFTRELGLQSYLVNGVRGSKGNKAALFRPGNILDLVSYFKKDHKTLHRLKEYHFGVIYRQLPFNIVKSSLALFLIEVLNKVIKEEDPNLDLYDFVHTSFVHLDLAEADLGSFHIHFLGQLAHLLGFHPGGKFSNQRPYFDLKEGVSLADMPPHTYYLSPRLTAAFFHEPMEPTLSTAERRLLLEKMLQFYALHVEHFGDMRSWEVLSEVFAGMPAKK